MKPAKLLAALLAGGSALALAAPYQPQQAIQGEIRIWGSPEDGPLLELWDEGFRKAQPQARVTATLHGPESTMAGIYTGVADIAFVGRELRLPVENMAFEWVKLHKPTTIEVANAGIRAQRVAATLGVFVHKDNPLAGLTIAQLDAIFGVERKRGGAVVATWGDLGLTGEWRNRPVHVLAPNVDSTTALFFRKAVLNDSFKWNPALIEFADPSKALEVLAADPSAIAYAPMAALVTLGDANNSVRALPLAARAGSFVTASAATIADRSYPLARTVIVAFDHAPDKPLDPRVREFLRFVLSDEGQTAVASDGAYIPLLPQTAVQQAKRLD